MPICIRYWTDDPTWIAHSHGIVGNILHHHAAATDNDIGADGDTWHYMYACTYPHIITNSDRTSILQPLVATLKVYGMSCCVETAVWPHEHIVSKPYLRSIQDNEVVVGIEVLAYLDIIAIVAPERSGNCENLFRPSQKSANQSLPPFRI